MVPASKRSEDIKSQTIPTLRQIIKLPTIQFTMPDHTMVKPTILLIRVDTMAVRNRARILTSCSHSSLVVKDRLDILRNGLSTMFLSSRTPINLSKHVQLLLLLRLITPSIRTILVSSMTILTSPSPSSLGFKNQSNLLGRSRLSTMFLGTRTPLSSTKCAPLLLLLWSIRPNIQPIQASSTTTIRLSPRQLIIATSLPPSITPRIRSFHLKAHLRRPGLVTPVDGPDGYLYCTIQLSDDTSLSVTGAF